MELMSKLGRLFVLGGMAYLGFYVYGIVMRIPEQRAAMMREAHVHRQRRGF